MRVLVRPLLVLVALALGCDDPPRAARPVDAGVATVPLPPFREGCVRSGMLEAIEADPTCVVKHASEDAMRAVMKNLSVTLKIEPAEVVSGGTALAELTMKNTSPVEITLLFEARTRPPGPRTDWSRVAGIPEPQANAPEANRMFFSMTTADSYDHDVDAVPTVAGSAGTTTPTLLAVHLRPGGKLVRVMSWWALSIPAPAPIVKDDAGHRYVPKTAAQHLSPGTYSVTVELPLYGLDREERKVSAHVRVIRAPAPDGGVRHGTF